MPKRFKIGLAICAIVTMTVWPPTAMVIAIGMLPTFVAFAIDRTRGRWAAQCVGAPNFAGVLPFVIDLWLHGHSVNTAERILTDPFSLSSMYGGAAIGWLLFVCVPVITNRIFRVLAQRRVVDLRARQKKLLEEWGDNVANPFE